MSTNQLLLAILVLLAFHFAPGPMATAADVALIVGVVVGVIVLLAAGSMWLDRLLERTWDRWIAALFKRVRQRLGYPE